MKRYLICLYGFVLQIHACAYCQNTNLFEEYFNKYEWCSLPISTDSMIMKYGDVGNSLSFEEFNTFIKDDIGDFWRYRLFVDNQKQFFEYIPTCKFKITEELIGLLCCCFYYDDDIRKERVEVILFIYDKTHKISSMTIAGNRFDNFVSDIVFDEIRFRATILAEKNIAIDYEIYNGKEEKEQIEKKCYYINKKGEILEKKCF